MNNAPQQLHYSPSGGESRPKYDTSQWRCFREDPVAEASAADLDRLATSPHWEDRVRAEVLRQHLRVELPAQFPCIYETSDSPRRAGAMSPSPQPWVVSPDIEMLTVLLPAYQQLWDSYTSQWGPRSRRTFTVGRLDGLSAHGVYRPGVTPDQVIAATMVIHDGMYRRAPQHLRKLHPMHATWFPPAEEQS